MMSHRRDLESRRAGRDMEHMLVMGIVALIAIGAAIGVVTEIILPAFEQATAALEAATNRGR